VKDTEDQKALEQVAEADLDSKVSQRRTIERWADRNGGPEGSQREILMSDGESTREASQRFAAGQLKSRQ